MDEAKKSVVFDILPDEYSYVITNFTEIEEEVQLNGPPYVVEVRVSGVFNEADAIAWLNKFEDKTGTQWRVRNTYSTALSKRIVFKKGYRCHNNTLPDKGKGCHKKNTDCPCSLILTVRRGQMKTSNDKYEEYPLGIYLKHNHNHLIKVADALRFLKPSNEIKEKFLTLFKNGHSPSSALDSHKFDMQSEFGDGYYLAAADGSKCPSLGWCYREYYKIFKEKYGESTGDAMVKDLQKFVDLYNKNCEDTCAKVLYEASDNPSSSDLIVAICSPLMKRVHTELRSSGEVVFVDSSGTMDRHNTRIFIMSAPSVAGALPLGILLTYSESDVALQKGFKLLQTMVPEKAFGGRGSEGPSIFMTDNCGALRSSLSFVFSAAILLLCVFHTLQAMWKYIWDSHHKVNKPDRAPVMDLFKSLVYCEDKNYFNDTYDKVLSDPLINKYTIVKKHISDLAATAKDWAKCLRSHLLTRNHDTDNYSEATFRVMKDKVFNRLKAYNVVQTFDFLVTRFHSYLERRIVDTLNNRSLNVTKSRYYIPIEKTKCLECTELGNNTYEVYNSEKKTKYIVHTDVEKCTCPVGEQGAPCKHQYAVVLKSNASSSQFVPTYDSEAKEKLHKMLYGTAPQPNWYTSLRGNESVSAENAEEISSSAAFVDEQTEAPSDDKENADPSCNEGEIEKVYSDLINFAEEMKAKMENRGSVFLPAVKTFLSSYSKQNSESSLVSALHSFGKIPASTPRRMTTIPVNSSSVARRTAYVGGRRLQSTGRPSKDYVRSESAKRTADPTWVKPPAKKATPHSLSQCISQNISLGKNHSKK